jgi:hypothetical protein
VDYFPSLRLILRSFGKLEGLIYPTSPRPSAELCIGTLNQVYFTSTAFPSLFADLRTFQKTKSRSFHNLQSPPDYVMALSLANLYLPSILQKPSYFFFLPWTRIYFRQCLNGSPVRACAGNRDSDYVYPSILWKYFFLHCLSHCHHDSSRCCLDISSTTVASDTEGLELGRQFSHLSMRC